MPPCGTIGVPGLVRKLEDRRHFGDRGRPQHHRRMAVEHVAHFDQVRRLRLRIGDGDFSPTIAAKRASSAGSILVWRLVEHGVLLSCGLRIVAK